MASLSHLSNLSIKLGNIAARQNLLTYAQGDHLDALGIMVNTYRIPAKGATVTLRYTLPSLIL